MWKFQHPEGQREINELHVPVGRPIKLLLTSEDVIHSFFVPDFRVHMDVLPGRYTSVWFQPTRPATYHLFCSQYCGTNHAGMIGTVIVMEPADYENWLHLQAEGSLALEGRKMFLKYRCVSCHSADENARAPGAGGPVRQAGPPATTAARSIADEDYLRESILDPGAKIVAGYENIMPTFKGQVSEEEIYRADRLHQVAEAGRDARRGSRSIRRRRATPPIERQGEETMSTAILEPTLPPLAAAETPRENYLNVAVRRRRRGC